LIFLFLSSLLAAARPDTDDDDNTPIIAVLLFLIRMQTLGVIRILHSAHVWVATTVRFAGTVAILGNAGWLRDMLQTLRVIRILHVTHESMATTVLFSGAVAPLGDTGRWRVCGWVYRRWMMWWWVVRGRMVWWWVVRGRMVWWWVVYRRMVWWGVVHGWMYWWRVVHGRMYWRWVVYGRMYRWWVVRWSRRRVIVTHKGATVSVAVQLELALVVTRRQHFLGHDEAVHVAGVAKDNDLGKGGDDGRTELATVVRFGDVNVLAGIENDDGITIVLALAVGDKVVQVLRATFGQHKHPFAIMGAAALGIPGQPFKVRNHIIGDGLARDQAAVEVEVTFTVQVLDVRD
jgi:hypothetical protein